MYIFIDTETGRMVESLGSRADCPRLELTMFDAISVRLVFSGIEMNGADLRDTEPMLSLVDTPGGSILAGITTWQKTLEPGIGTVYTGQLNLDTEPLAGITEDRLECLLEVIQMHPSGSKTSSQLVPTVLVRGAYSSGASVPAPLSRDYASLQQALVEAQEKLERLNAADWGNPFVQINFKSGATITSQRNEETNSTNIMLGATNIQTNATISAARYIGAYTFQGFPANCVITTAPGGQTIPLSYAQLRDKLDVPTRAEAAAGINNAFAGDIYIGGGVYVASFGSAAKGKGLCVGSNGQIIVEPNAARVIEMSEAVYKSFPVIDSKTFYLTTDMIGSHKLYLGSTLIIANKKSIEFIELQGGGTKEIVAGGRYRDLITAQSWLVPLPPPTEEDWDIVVEVEVKDEGSVSLGTALTWPPKQLQILGAGYWRIVYTYSPLRHGWCVSWDKIATNDELGN